MAETPQAGDTLHNPSAGHLSVHLEGEHPPEVPFLFDWQPRRTGWSMVTSMAINAAIVALALFLPRLFPSNGTVTAFLPEEPNDSIVWLAVPGPGGGGGGGGNQMKEPPRPAVLPGKDKVTIPVAEPPKLQPPEPAKEPELVTTLNIPAQSLASATESLPGAIETPPGPPAISQGAGVGGGAGTGAGTGIGSGRGSGLGAGFGGGTGGGAYRPGNGVTVPVLIKEVKPSYTSDAMRAKVQGTVLLECIVRQDGTVTDVRVVRSLDPTFGLDLEAIKAAREWRFRPGTRFGEPVPVLVTIELMFTLR
jgi:protein TonB